MRIDPRTYWITLVLAAAALNVSCSDDDSGDPVAPPAEETVLATATGGGSSSGPDEPQQPYGMRIEIGVADRVIPGYTDLPDPIVFKDRIFGDNTDFIARPLNTLGLGIAADRLSDGEDNTVYIGMYHLSGGGSSFQGLESTSFDYDPGLNRVGPDFQGHTVTGLRVQLDMEVTESGGRWTEAYTCTLTVLGY